MKNTMEYKGYVGSVEFSEEAPETHKQLVIHATACQMSLNEYVRETLEKAVM